MRKVLKVLPAFCMIASVFVFIMGCWNIFYGIQNVHIGYGIFGTIMVIGGIFLFVVNLEEFVKQDFDW